MASNVSRIVLLGSTQLILTMNMLRRRNKGVGTDKCIGLCPKWALISLKYLLVVRYAAVTPLVIQAKLVVASQPAPQARR